MNKKTLVISTIIFFLLVNTSYYWEGKLGALCIPIFLFLVVGFFVLVIILLQQIFFAVKEKFANRQRILIVVMLAVVLLLAFLKPTGIIDFDKLEGNNILIAEREGAANCTTVFRLKENNKFSEKSFCFGITEVKGDYHIKGDTIFFDNVKLSRGQNEFYRFAVVKPSKLNMGNIKFELVRYKDIHDTIGHLLFVTKNELVK